MSFRTVQGAHNGRSIEGFSETDESLDSDFVPMMLILSAGYLTIDLIAYLTFDLDRELNMKIYNEVLKLRGKPGRF